MSVWLFQDYGSSIKFTTAGGTGSGGRACMQGPTTFTLSHRSATQSFYANGSFNFQLGSTRGLANYIAPGSGSYSTTAKTVVSDMGTSVRLGTQGLTGIYTGNFLHPEGFKTVDGSYDTVYGEKYQTVTIKIHDGIIYGWQDSISVKQGSSSNITTTPGINVESPPGVGFINNGTSMRAVAGLTGSISYYLVYDVYFIPEHYSSNPSPYWWTFWNKIYYSQLTIVLSSGLIQSVTDTPQGYLYYKYYVN